MGHPLYAVAVGDSHWAAVDDWDRNLEGLEYSRPLSESVQVVLFALQVQLVLPWSARARVAFREVAAMSSSVNGLEVVPHRIWMRRRHRAGSSMRAHIQA